MKKFNGYHDTLNSIKLFTSGHSNPRSAHWWSGHFVISMRMMAEVPARFSHRNIAVDTGLLRIIVVIFVVVIINIAIGRIVVRESRSLLLFMMLSGLCQWSLILLS